MKFNAPQFSDINLFTWDPKGFSYGDQNYESNGTKINGVDQIMI